MLRIQKILIQFTKSLQPQLAAIRTHDPELAGQAKRALGSIGLNLGEGYGASGGSKRRAYRIAAGESTELQMGLEMAVALDYCELSDEQRKTLGRIVATVRKLAKPVR